MQPEAATGLQDAGWGRNRERKDGMNRWQTRIEYLVTVCGFCRGQSAHSCSLHSCREAVGNAEEYYRQERERIRMEEYEGSTGGRYYGKTVMEALHDVLGVRMDADRDAVRQEYSLDEILDAVLTYEGILGYSGKLVRIIEEIFGVNLLEIDV